MDNVLFWDNSLCVINIIIASEPKREVKSENYYTKVIPLYDLMKGNSFDWDMLKSVNLDSLLKDKSPKEMSDTIIPKIGEAVKLHMKLLDNSKPSGFSSNNLIPMVVREIFKKKCRLSKQLRSVTSVSRCTNIHDNIQRLDVELKHYYEERQ